MRGLMILKPWGASALAATHSPLRMKGKLHSICRAEKHTLSSASCRRPWRERVWFIFNFLIYSCAPTKPYREQLWRTGWEVPWSESYHWGQFGYGSTLYGCYVIIALAYAILKLIKFDFFIYLIYPSDRYWWGIESSWRFSEIKSGIAVQNERGPKQINVNFTVCISASTSTLNFLIFFFNVNEEKSLYILCLQFDLLTNPVIAEGYNKENGKCRYTYSNPIYPFKQFLPVVFAFKKNGPYTKPINAQ